MVAVVGVRLQAIYQAVARGRAARAEWVQFLGACHSWQPSTAYG